MGVLEPGRATPAVHFLSSGTPEADTALTTLTELYGQVPPEKADVLVALGGDGLMLQVLHKTMAWHKPIYGMNRGTVGFLMNEFAIPNLHERLAVAEPSIVHPLIMAVECVGGERANSRAINEVYLWRQSYQAAKLKVLIDGKERMAELIADGLMVATPAGSTAYNLSANGPILPLNAPMMALTPVSAFRPRRWRGALLPDHVSVTVEVLEAAKRPVAATADQFEVKDVARIDIRMDHDMSLVLLHDPGHSLDERILREQFGY